MPPKTRKRTAKSTVEQGTGVEALAKKHWQGSAPKWSLDVVSDIMRTFITGDATHASLQTLERLQYLELYLWPNYAQGHTSDDYILSVLLMLNEKHQHGLQSTMWQIFADNNNNNTAFGALFDDAVGLALRVIRGTEFQTTLDEWTVRTVIVQFLVVCFGSIETACVREACMPLVSVSLWHHVTPAARERELDAVAQLRRFWKHESK
ncbi:hypothetical protein GGF43_006785, partial [Coemansia sp. RSA 2618]